MRMSISRKFQLLALPLIVLGFFTWWVAQRALNYNSDTLERALEIKSLSNRCIAFLHLQADATKAILLNPDLLVEYSDKKIKAFDESTAVINRIKELSDDATMRRLADDLERVYKEKIRPRDSMILEKLFDGTGTAVQLYFNEESARNYREFEQLNRSIYELAEKNANEAKTMLEEANRQSLLSIAASLGLGILFSLVIMLVLIHKVSHKMLSVSDKINDGAVYLSGAKNNISEVSHHLRSIADDGKARIGVAVDSVNRITASEKTHADEVEKASRMAWDAKQQTSSGTNLIAELNQNLQNLRKNMNGISEVIDIMNGLAFQTNILSLNAAVEAAHAGEHGKGFSVVAAAVRELAIKSKDSAQRVANIIRDGQNRIQQIESSANHTSVSFREIAQQVDGIASLIRNIAEASQKQTVDVEGVQGTLIALHHFSEQMLSISSHLELQSSELSAHFETVDHSAADLSRMVRGA